MDDLAMLSMIQYHFFELLNKNDDFLYPCCRKKIPTKFTSAWTFEVAVLCVDAYIYP